MANENTSAITRTVQLGPETTPGTAVPTTKKLSSIDITGSIQSDITSFRAAGSKFSTVHSLGKEWSEWEISSEAPCFDEMQYVLSSLISNPTATTPETTARMWTYAPTPGAEDTRKTFTIEEGHEFGGTDVAHKAAYGIGTSMTLDIDREGTKLGGSMLARAMASANLTSSGVTTLPTVPILPADWAVYLDTTSGALGTTRLTRVLGIKIAIEDVLGPLWTVDDSEASWVAHVETAPKCTVELTMQAEATAMGLLAVAKAGSTRYLRIANTSSTLAGATTYYSLTFDIAGQISEIGEFGDDQEVYTIGWTFEMTNDPAWGSGKPYQIALVNKQSGF